MSIASCHSDGSSFLTCGTDCNLDYIDYLSIRSIPSAMAPLASRVLPTYRSSSPGDDRGLTQLCHVCRSRASSRHFSGPEGGLPIHTPPRPRILRETCLRLRVSEVMDSHRSSPRALSEATESPQTHGNPGSAIGGVTNAALLPAPGGVVGDSSAVETSVGKPQL